jgi:hypothetical protein
MMINMIRRMPRKTLTFAVLATTLLGAQVSSAAEANASQHLVRLADVARGPYGPAASRFWAAFPSKPESARNTPGLLQNFPAGVDVYGYWVSQSKDVFGTTAPVPTAPSYMVIVGLFSSVAAATRYLVVVSQAPGLKPVRGAQVYEFLGPEDSPLNSGNKLSDPRAIEGLLVLRMASTTYTVIAITMKRSTTSAFLTSFKAHGEVELSQEETTI